MESKKQIKFDKFDKARKEAKKLIRSFNLKLNRSVASQVKVNPKKFWAHIKSKTKLTNDIPDLITSVNNDGSSNMTSSAADRAEALSSYFSTVFTREPDIDVQCISSENIKNVPLMPIFTVQDDQVAKKINSLNVSKSPGPDNLHPRVLKEIVNEICQPLTILFNASIKLSTIPQEWKLADITAVYKKGDRNVCGNYRPISLTSIICKILESIIRDKLVEHMKINKLISNKQFGFLKGRSATLQLLNVIDDWSKILDSGEIIDVIYTDFQKAFDTVPHRRLITKLKSYGIEANLVNWITSFLTNRKQRVKVNGIASSWANVLSGIPQGSVLGPILFVIYINDIVDNLTGTAYLFADDMKIYNVIRDEEDCVCLQKDIDMLLEWTDKWLLRFNVSKCKVVRIGKCIGDHHDYYMPSVSGMHKLELSKSEKDLGIIIDSELSFDGHIHEVIKKANRLIGLIKRNFNHLDVKSFVMLYKSLVRSHLEYGQSVWSPYLVKHIDALESVQRRATRILPKLKNLTYAQRLRILQLPTLAYRRLRGDMIETFKILNGYYDADVVPYLHPAVNNTTRGHNKKLYKLQSSKNIRKYTFSVRIVCVWNSLPFDVVNAPSINAFKNRFDKYFANQDILYDYKAEIYIGNLR